MRSILLLSAGALGALLLPSCSDSATCVFTTGCQDGGGGPGAIGAEATPPVDGQVVRSGPPEVVAVLPDGLVVAPTTPVLVVFSESMAPETVEAVEVVQLAVGGFPVQSPLSTPAVLVGDGRVLAILPALLPQGDGVNLSNDYLVRVAPEAELRDLTGQAAALDGGAELGLFSIDVAAPDDAQVVAIVPGDVLPGGAQPTVTPIVVAFDRPVDEALVDGDSFVVEVDGADPAVDPDPEPLVATTPLGPLADERVYVWRALDGGGELAPLPTGATVDVTVSPAGAPIAGPGLGTMPTATASFATQAFHAPTAAALLSSPMDAIGVANLTPGDPEALAIQVDLDGAEPGDVLVTTIVGASPEDPSQLVALSRTKTLEGSGPIAAVVLTLADLDLTASTSPVVPRFDDGPLAFAFHLRRGTATSAVHRLDVDPVLDGPQDPVQDTTPPALVELLRPGGGTTDLLRADVRDLVVVGTASEPVRSVEVDAGAVGTNGVLPPVVGAGPDGLFVAAPVALPGGVASGPVPFEVTLYDDALNASAPIAATYEQVGVLGPGALVPGGPVQVEVVDAETLAPIEGALVQTYEVGASPPPAPVQLGETDASGTVSVAAAAGGPTLLAVAASGYDLVAVHGLASDRASLALRPTALGTATATGEVTTTSAFAELTLDLLQRKLDDARRPHEDTATFDGGPCTPGGPFGAGLSCAYGPETIVPGRLGVQSFLAGTFLLDEGSFGASQLLQAFALSGPRAPVVGGETDAGSLVVPFLLNEPGVDPTELAVELPEVTLDTLLTDGIDALDDDPETTGLPRVAVEALVPGVPGATTVGLGLAYARGGGTWSVRSARPGAVGPAGALGASGAVEPDPLLRIELRDPDGDRTGQRPRVSALDDLPVPFRVYPLAVPRVLSPVGSTGGASFRIEVLNSIPDVAAQPGLYRIELVDAAGRGWTFWRADPPDGEAAFVDVPDPASLGVVLTGPLEVGVQAFAWPSLDFRSLLFTDVAREHDHFAEAAPVPLTYP